MDARAGSPPLHVGAKRTASGHAVRAPASGLAALPPFLAHSILLAAVPTYELENLTIDNARASKPFQALSSVSKQWRALALDVVSSVTLRTLVVSVGSITRKDVLDLRRQLTLRRPCLLSLDIQRIPTRDRKIGRGQWAAILSCVPRLQEIKLVRITNATNAQLGAIVRAVGLQCKNLQSLVISAAHRNNGEDFYPTESQCRQLSDPVYYTMEQVYKHANHIGLRRLCICMRFDLRGLRYTRKYINHVLRFCPNVEVFDGYRASVNAVEQRLCYEEWFMDFDLWTRFCATLHNLVEFDWICVPFATRFFEIFGQHAKPKLKAMSFTTATNWSWSRFLRDVGPQHQQQLIDSGFADTAKNPQVALRACPNLEELTVSWLRVAPAQSRTLPLPVPVTATMNPEIFGDEFWEAAATLCPSLTSLTLVPVDKSADGILTTFTDRSLRAIATLPFLSYFGADNVNVTGDGIFALAAQHVSATTKVRRFQISLGDQPNDDTDMRFYDTIKQFLMKLLAAEAPLPCITGRLYMSIRNLRDTPVDKEWSEPYLTELVCLIEQVNSIHPSVVLNVFAFGCDGTTFTQIKDFVFSTDAERTLLSMEDGDTRVADSLWRRVDYFAGETLEMDDDDEDEGEDNDEDEDDYDDDSDAMDYDIYGGEDDRAFWGSGRDNAHE